MINSLATYHDIGRKAGKAARNHDIGLLNHMASWMRQAERMETPEDRKIAREEYNKAYTAHARG